MGAVRQPAPDWCSFYPILIKAVELTDGPVLELGAGIFSTPLLHALCKDRKFVSYDNDSRFILPKFKVTQLIEDWDSVDLSPNWSVAFVDHKPEERRKEDIKRLTHAEFVVVHDTQPIAEEYYKMSEVYPLFKYRYDYTVSPTWTSVLSNTRPWPQ